jgi:DNA-binding MarR family transcriptional regulator
MERFGRLMRSLQHAKGVRQSPWDDCPLTLPQLRALSLLARSERGLIGRELAEQLRVGPSAVTPIVDRLEEHAYLMRQDDPEDRRATHLRVTDAGRDLLERMTSGHTELMRDILAQLTEDELNEVGHAFDILLGAVQKALADTPSQTADSRLPR